MKREVTVKAPTVEEAVEKAIAELGADRAYCQVEILEKPKKSIFGKKDAQVRVTAEEPEQVPVCDTASPSRTDADASLGAIAPVEKKAASDAEKDKVGVARQYLTEIIRTMGLTDVTLRITENEDGAVVTFEGDGMAVLIGHHGETLDALQYLVALTCNRVDGEYYRITLDCGNYREKREATLQALAGRIAAKVKKTGRSQLLEPMNPYERRIIHAVVSEIEGVSSKSKGEEPNRRVVILSDTPVKATFNRNNNRREDFSKKPSYPPKKRERTMEEILKSDTKKTDFAEKEESAALYSKLDL